MFLAYRVLIHCGLQTTHHIHINRTVTEIASYCMWYTYVCGCCADVRLEQPQIFLPNFWLYMSHTYQSSTYMTNFHHHLLIIHALTWCAQDTFIVTLHVKLGKAQGEWPENSLSMKEGQVCPQECRNSIQLCTWCGSADYTVTYPLLQ